MNISVYSMQLNGFEAKIFLLSTKIDAS